MKILKTKRKIINERISETQKESLKVIIPEVKSVSIPTLFVTEPKSIFLCTRCGGTMELVKDVKNEKLWKCEKCQWQYCKMR